ncbi:MAG: GGDEF domain-containing protein [Betaproteobacteria bacterium]|nr:GGDEF domain-containing protein [Betaproteobacteria bacterium]
MAKTTGIMEAAKEYLMHAVGRILDDMSTSELRCLFMPSKHPPMLTSRRMTLISSRVRMVAALFAILTPLWTVIDLLVFAWPIWPQLAFMRVTASVAFAILALSGGDKTKASNAYRELGVLFAIPIIFFVTSHSVLAHYQMQGAAEAIATGYAFLPFVMVAGLSVFPLTAVEGIIYSLPIVAAEIGVALAGADGLDWSSHLGAVWLLLLIAAVSTMAGMSQLGFMMALVRQASRDALTGSFTRASGEELLEIQFDISRRSDTPLAIAFVDLDDFKSVNDVHGHEAGDAVLSNAVQAMRNALRSSDILARWGGEEFILILTNTNRHEAIVVVERIRAGGLGLRPDGKPVTASFGIAVSLAERTENWHDLVEIADKRMYAAKQSGKDRLVADTPETFSAETIRQQTS